MTLFNLFYFQVDFGKIANVKSIATQGRNSAYHFQWVKSYQLSYSKNGNTWLQYREDTPKVRYGFIHRADI